MTKEDIFCNRFTIKGMHYCKNRGIPSQDASDVVQDAFIAFFEAGYGHKPEGEWAPIFIVILQRRVMDYFRKGGMVFQSYEDASNDDQPVEEVPETEPHDPLSEAAVQEALKALDVFIKTLPEKHREVMVGRLFNNQSFDEIAEMLSMNVDGVKTVYARNMTVLRPFLEEFV